MVICDGRGSGGTHCCIINGTVCQFLLGPDPGSDDPPRCGMWDRMDSEEWKHSLVGRWFRQNHPGKNCKDWPQNIPAVMAKGIGLCCWSDVSQVRH